MIRYRVPIALVCWLFNPRGWHGYGLRFCRFMAQSSGGNISVFREYIGFPVFSLLLGKSKWFSHFANHLKPNRSTDVCVLLLAVTTADPLAQLEKVAEKFDLPADASFFLKDLCGPTP